MHRPNNPCMRLLVPKCLTHASTHPKFKKAHPLTQTRITMNVPDHPSGLPLAGVHADDDPWDRGEGDAEADGGVPHGGHQGHQPHGVHGGHQAVHEAVEMRMRGLSREDGRLLNRPRLLQVGKSWRIRHLRKSSKIRKTKIENSCCFKLFLSGFK